MSSNIELPEAIPLDGEPDAADIQILRESFDFDKGAARPVTHRSYLDHQGSYLLEIDGVARFKISDARRISIEAASGAAWPEIRAYLFGTVLTALCYMRGIIPLHGSCAAKDGCAIAMIGASGAGKSTLAACLGKQGWSIIADDTCAIDMSSTRPLVLPTVSRLKLWPDSVQIAQLESANSGQNNAQGKFLFYKVDNAEVNRSPTALDAILVLERSKSRTGPSVELIRDPKDAIGLLLSNLPRKRIMQALAINKPVIDAIAKIVSQATIFRLQRPDGAGVHDLTVLVREALAGSRQSNARS